MEMEGLTRGIVYVATGARFLNEAKQSANSVKAIMPAMKICLITDSEEINDPVFDDIIINKVNAGAKIYKQSMHLCPYDLVVFLDTDTYVAADLSELFEILEYFDVAANQISSGYHYKLDGLPNAFPEFNSGVIAFRNTSKVKLFFQEWTKYFLIYQETLQNTWDQMSFRMVIYKSDLRIAPLPYEYNFMVYFPGYAMTDLKIVHGRTFEKLQRVAKEMNQELGHRVYLPRIGVVKYFYRMSIGQMGKLVILSTRLLFFGILEKRFQRLGIANYILKLRR